VLFGDGQHQAGTTGPVLPPAWNARPATLQNLLQTMSALDPQLSPTEQFLFYASDHGGLATALKDPRVAAVTVTLTSPFLDRWALGNGELEGMGMTQDNDPAVGIQYSGLDSMAPVFLNDMPIGQLLPGQTFMNLSVPESLLAADNTFRIESGGDSSFLLQSAVFYTGNINTLLFIPEPSAAPGFVLLLLALRRRRSRPTW
jgi:hypothetical protein